MSSDGDVLSGVVVSVLGRGRGLLLLRGLIAAELHNAARSASASSASSALRANSITTKIEGAFVSMLLLLLLFVCLLLLLLLLAFHI